MPDSLSSADGDVPGLFGRHYVLQSKTNQRSANLGRRLSRFRKIAYLPGPSPLAWGNGIQLSVGRV